MFLKIRDGSYLDEVMALKLKVLIGMRSTNYDQAFTEDIKGTKF